MPLPDTTHEYVIQVEHRITGEMIDDMLTAAFEGGITYWCDSVRVFGDDYKGATYASDVISRHGRVVIHCDESPFSTGQKNWTIGLNEILTAWPKAMKFLRQDAEEFYEDHDASSADILVQFACFGEVIFG